MAFICALIIIGSIGYDIPRIAEVTEGYPADTAGIEAGDIITSINGRSINTMDDLKNILSYKKYDTEIEVTYSTLGRSGYTENTITVKRGKKSMFNKGGSN